MRRDRAGARRNAAAAVALRQPRRVHDAVRRRGRPRRQPPSSVPAAELSERPVSASAAAAVEQRQRRRDGVSAREPQVRREARRGAVRRGEKSSV